jgi:hypothetical protein
MDQRRERIRYLHYSLQTEKAYLYWEHFFCPLAWARRHHAAPARYGRRRGRGFRPCWRPNGMCRHPTHKQALSALLFLYREVLGVDLPHG